jgi:SAM-dependent methyltransferase
MSELPSSLALEQRVWQRLPYAPAVRSCSATRLLARLPKTALVLEVGCGNGDVCIELAGAGHRVWAVDINEGSVRAAHGAAASRSLAIDFIVADAVEILPLPGCDAVVLTRVATCFPELTRWQSLIRGATASLVPGGLLYIHDFLFDPNMEAYCDRYIDGIARGWRRGNVLVQDANGHPLFVAHHHTLEDLAEITGPYSTAELHPYRGTSMHGNACTMFELIACL